ncbi:TIGR03560 family F420-dependent LLM class oxidoreductase [Actinomycetospora sp. CA-101289]|uniref:TIGR03560 family F420-dependent LLM class oxidoreductase n=1 Tax=Actinomycetospora sp. CA-101289 TaxID=3239893 RepID=UPI003D984C18
MHVSISITDVSGTEPAGLAGHLVDTARAADDAGLDTLWVADHLLQAIPGTSVDDPVLEAFTTLGFLAAHTRRLRLGTLVAGVTFRPPALLIKAVTTLDVLSGGRAWLGVGAGYHQEEAEATGLPLPPTPERFGHLEDTLRLAQQMWRGDTSPFTGTHHRAAHPVSSPAPLTRPRPPILVGGMGERQTLRLVARYADACNLFDIPDGGATLRRKLDVLAGHCAAIDRPFDEILTTVSTRLQPDEPAAAFVERCAALADLGIDHAVVITAGPWTAARIDTLGRAAADLAGVTARSRSA